MPLKWYEKLSQTEVTGKIVERWGTTRLDEYNRPTHVSCYAVHGTDNNGVKGIYRGAHDGHFLRDEGDNVTIKLKKGNPHIEKEGNIAEIKDDGTRSFANGITYKWQQIISIS